MQYNKYIEEIFLKKFGQKVKCITDRVKGVDHEVFFAKTAKSDYVIRFPKGDKRSLFAEVWATKAWFKMNLPFPKVILLDVTRTIVNNDYLIEEKIEGKDLDEIKLNKEQLQTVYFQLGKIVKRMHDVRTMDYGWLIAEKAGCDKSWRAWIKSWTKSDLASIETERILLASTIHDIRKIYSENDNILDFKNPKLLHGDLRMNNIIVLNGKLNGIVDTSDALSGDPMYDLGIINQNTYGLGVWDSFIKGYGKVDMQKVNFYSLIAAVMLVKDFEIKHKDWSREAYEIIKTSLDEYVDILSS